MKLVWFGYKNKTDEYPFCMLQKIVDLQEYISLLQEYRPDTESGRKLQIGDWILSYGSCQHEDGIQMISSPHKEDCLGFALEMFGIKTFKTSLL